MTLSLTHTFATDDAIIADEVMDNLNDLLEGLGNITNSMIASGAGITSDKLSDRYIVEEPSFPVLPHTQTATDIATVTEYVAPSAETVVYRYKVSLASGQDAYLCAVNVYLANVTVSGGNYPTLSIYVNSVLIGGATVVLDNEGDPNGFFKLGKSSPIASPLLALADGDTIEVRLSRQGGTPTLAGLTVSPVIKKELVP